MYPEKARRSAGLARSLVASVCVLTLFYLKPSLLNRWAECVQDALYACALPTSLAPFSYIVAIDSRSIAEIGDWPWPPGEIARLVKTVSRGEPRAIGLDLCGELDGTRLERAIRQVRNVVVGYRLRFGRGESTPAPNSISSSEIGYITNPWGAVRDYNVVRAQGLECLDAAVVGAAAGCGFVNIIPDGDGVVRAVPLVARLGGRPYNSFAIAVLKAYTGARRVCLRLSGGTVTGIQLDGIFVRSGPDAGLRLRDYPEEGGVPVVSAVDLLRGAIDPLVLKNRIALISGTARREFPCYVNRLSETRPGIYFQATAMENILHNQYLRESPLSIWMELLLIIGLPLSIPIFCPLFGRAWARYLIPAGAMAVIFGVAIYLLRNHSEMVSVFYPSLSVLLSLVSYCMGWGRNG